MPISLLFVPANFAQGVIPAWAFRGFEADRALKTRRHYVIWTVWGILIVNLVGSLRGSAMLAFVIKAPGGDAYTFPEFDRMFRNAGFSSSELHPLPPTFEQVVISQK